MKHHIRKINIKNVFYFLLLTICIIPIVTSAEILNYNDSVNKIETYIESNRYSDRSKYLLFSVPYIYENGTLSTNSSFKKGGFLSKSEYDISKFNSNSYLSPGIEYWTLTSSGSNNKYYIGVDIAEKPISSTSGVRVTQFVLPEVKVSGYGTYNNPWYFIPRYTVTFRTNSIEFGGIVENNTIVSHSAKLVSENDKVNVLLRSKPGYKYSSNNCALLHAGGESYTSQNITNNVNCLINFEANSYIVTFDADGGNTSQTTKTVTYNNKYGTLPSATRVGYDFEGWYTSKNGQGIKITEESTVSITENTTLYAKWKQNTVICSAGNYLASNATNCTKCEVGYYCSGGTFSVSQSIQGRKSCPSGYTSAAGVSSQTSCYVSVSAGKYKTSATGSTVAACETGKYSLAHNSYYNSVDNSCTNCPIGYRDGVGATSESNCIRNVPAGNYIATSKATTETMCAKGYYKAAHSVKYGSTSNCTACPSGQSSMAGAESCANLVCYQVKQNYCPKCVKKLSDNINDYSCYAGQYEKLEGIPISGTLSNGKTGIYIPKGDCYIGSDSVNKCSSGTGTGTGTNAPSAIYVCNSCSWSNANYSANGTTYNCPIGTMTLGGDGEPICGSNQCVHICTKNK